MGYVDLLIPCPAKLTLLQGEGPINLVGSHCVDFYGYRDLGSGDDDEDEEAAEAEAMDEGGETKKKTPTKEASTDKKTPSKEGSAEKRKASGDQQPKSGEKKKKESPAK